MPHTKNSVKNTRKICYALCWILFLLAAGEAAYLAGYRINFSTPSAPFGIWKTEPIAWDSISQNNIPQNNALSPLRRGDYVCADTAAMMEKYPAIKKAHEWGYFGHKLFSRQPFNLLKRVEGVPGDVIDVVNVIDTANSADFKSYFLVINGDTQSNVLGSKTLGSKTLILSVDSKGRTLPRLNFPIVLSRDEYWLTSDHAHGYDSRYFGSVHKNFIKYRMKAVFTW